MHFYALNSTLLCYKEVPTILFLDITVGKFVYEIRKHMKLNPEQAIFLFVNDTLPPTAALMSQIYEKNKDEDGFLYVTYSGENTFGGF